MVGKVALLFCAQALLAQVITSQCIGNAPWGAPYPGPWAGIPCAEASLADPCAPFVPSNGGGFLITSVSPIGITGVSLTSENAYEGPLNVAGAVPFLGAVALDGCLPTEGCGAITYGCGNGNIAMMSEKVRGYAPLAYEAAPAYGYGSGYNTGCGCGCSSMY